jgi:hypothetical protein
VSLFSLIQLAVSWHSITSERKWKMRNIVCITVLIATIVLGFEMAESAVLIDFEAQGAGAPSIFTNTLNSPLTIDGATFTGGQLLNNETTSGPDNTAVYATIGGTGAYTALYTNPLTITFNQPVSDFSVTVTNGYPEDYIVRESTGTWDDKGLPLYGQQTYYFSDSGVTSVTIETYAVPWNFAIDNVTFTPIPEPCTLLLLGPGLASLWVWGRKKFKCV